MRALPYTAVVGGEKRRDVYCYTGDGVFKRDVMEAKRYKILPHLFFPQADVTIWIDGNIWLALPADDVAQHLLGPHDQMALFRHSYRSTVWQEFATLKEDRRFAIPYLQAQLTAQGQAYAADGLPSDAPLYECNVLVRRNCAAVNRVMDAWWAQICRWQWRDQVSLPYVLWKYGSDLRLAAHTGNVRDHSLFRYVPQY